MAPPTAPPAGLPIAPSTPRKHSSSHHRLSPWPLGLPSRAPLPSRRRSRSLHGFPSCALYSTLHTLVCLLGVVLPSLPNGFGKVSCLPGPSPGRLNLASCAVSSLDSGLQSLLDTRAGCCPALGQGTTFVRRPSEGPSATLMQADIGTTHREGAYNSTGYFPPRYRSQEARDQAPCTPLDCRSSTTGLGNRLFLI